MIYDLLTWFFSKSSITEGWSFGVSSGDSSSGLNLSPTTSTRQPPHSQIAPPPMLGLAWLQICDYKWCRLLWVLTTMVVCEGGRLGAKISKVKNCLLYGFTWRIESPIYMENTFHINTLIWCNSNILGELSPRFAKVKWYERYRWGLIIN